MGLPNRDYAYIKKRTNRPASVALVAVAGVLASFAILGISLGLVWQRLRFGYGLGAQALDILLALLVTLLVVWLFWGIWELTPNSWWSHMIFGPLLIIGLLVFAGMVDTLAPFIAHHLPLNIIQQVVPWMRTLAFVLIGIEVVTIFVLLGQRKTFTIGRKKEVWERVKH